MKCPKDCPAPCCHNLVKKIKKVNIYNGLMLLPKEVKILSEFAKKFKVTLEILPQVGYGLKGRSRPRPEVVALYQLVNDTCPFFHRKRKKCLIYGYRPLACRAYPVTVAGVTIIESIANYKSQNFLSLDVNCPEVQKYIKNVGDITEEAIDILGLHQEKLAAEKIAGYKAALLRKHLYSWVYDAKKKKWVFRKAG